MRLPEQMVVQPLQLRLLLAKLPVQRGDALGGDQLHLELVAIERLDQVVVAPASIPASACALSLSEVRKMK